VIIFFDNLCVCEVVWLCKVCEWWCVGVFVVEGVCEVECVFVVGFVVC